VHSRYRRILRDLPWQGSAVELHIELRRFRCRVRDCPRKTFVERLPLVMAAHGRQTARLSETLRLIGYVLGGEAGSRLASRLGINTSPDTMLRRIKDGTPLPSEPARIIGIDDWAWRKGQRYGTVLVDLERHVPIDLLPDRSANSVAAWFREHPEVEVISRDRASLYAEGAATGAPQAIQVADRWHLLCNFTSAVERTLERRRGLLRSATDQPIQATPEETPEADERPCQTRAQERKEAHRQQRLELYNRVVELYQQGTSQQAISRELGLERKTVRRFLRAGRFPERAVPHRKPARVSAFRDYLEQRWREGCHNATQLWREIQAQGYTGGRGMVASLVSNFRKPGTKYFRKEARQTQRKLATLSPRQAAMLLARKTSSLDEPQQQKLARLTQCSAEIATMHRLAQDFAVLLKERRSEALETWMATAIASGLPEIKRFCDGLTRDHAAVVRAVSMPWSNGQVEGQVHRLKLIKRQMYGRAGFQLLKRRVLPFLPTETQRRGCARPP
jgi:transposase